jgi:uncharacterized membrane protein
LVKENGEGDASMNALDIETTENQSREQIWQILLNKGLVSGVVPAVSGDESSVQQAWYIRVMLGFSGWLGALFLMGFVGIGLQFVMKNASVSFVVGIACCAAAFVIFKNAKNSDFVMQFGLAISLTGQGIFVVGLFTAFKENNPLLYLIALIFQLALTALMPNSIHRFLTTLGTTLAAVFLLQNEGVYGIAHGLIAIVFTSVCLSSRFLLNPALWRPIAYGLSFALLYTEGGRLFHPYYFWMHGGDSSSWWLQYGWWVGSSLVNLALLVSTAIILGREKMPIQSKLGVASLVICVLLCIGTYFAPGLSAALLIIFIGFSSGNRVLTGIGFLALVGFVSHYYYQMQATLLFKSMLLAITALILLSMRIVFHRLLPENLIDEPTQIEGDEHA